MPIWLRHIVLVVLLSVVGSGVSLSQDLGYTAKDPRYTFSAGMGFVIPPSDMEGFHETRAGKMYYGEGLYRIGNTPFDVGLYGNYVVFNRISSVDSLTYDFSMVNVLAVANYNRRVFKHLRFFAGVGIGVLDMGSWIVKRDRRDPAESNSKHRIALSSMLRFGVDLYNVVRISWGYNLQKTTYRYGFMSLGVVFGGGGVRRKANVQTGH